MKLNYDKLMADQPVVFWSCCNYDLVEHPHVGDEYPVIAVCHALKAAWNTTYYDPLGDEGDMADIEWQYQQLKGTQND